MRRGCWARAGTLNGADGLSATWQVQGSLRRWRVPSQLPHSILLHHPPLASPHTPPPPHTAVWAPALYPEVILLGGHRDK